MLMDIILFLILITLLSLINFFLVKSKKFIHINVKDEHKKFGLNKIPLSGGLFFFIILFYLNIEQNYENYLLILFIFLNLFLGLLVDYGIEIKPKVRLFFQILLTVNLIFFYKISIIETNINFLDYFLNNFIFNIFFTSFCILIVVNGLNFMDGVNNNVIGYFVLLLSAIIVIESKNFSIDYLNFYKLLLYASIVFYFFNFFNKNYLGDSGIYVLSIFISVIVIEFVNKSSYVSPLIAINFLWYPAFETLFSIIRKLFFKNNPFKPDTKHLHGLILTSLKTYNFKNANTISGTLLNLALLPNFFIAINYYNNSVVILITTIIYLVLYIFIYIKLFMLKKKF
jgi:UDP-N-acetylmuramyl pentapeptide phosphotransferase/UDP-N-acetylglucosamine-1-phosphate transferase